MLLPVFESMLLASFALLTLALGVFTTAFGAGKSRRIGTALVLLGLVASLVFVAVSFGLFPEVVESPWTLNDVLLGVVGAIGAFLGGVIALMVFLVSIMRV